MEKDNTEKLKDSFYQIVKNILDQEMIITNIGVQKKFQKFVLHAEKIMTHTRIENQFKLACEKYTSKTGVQTDHQFHAISKWISQQPKNY